MGMNVVVGPPCAGKSTYAREAATDGEPVVDFDLLALAFGNTQQHSATGLIKRVTFEARDAAIALLKKNADQGSWVIHTSPSVAELAEYAALGAAFHLVDPGMAVCLARAQSDERPEFTASVIEGWYTNPPAMPEGTTTYSSAPVALLQADHGFAD